MIENITEKQLQKIIEEYALQDSNIGVHNMTGVDDYEKAKEVYDRILKNGFNARGGVNETHGITTHICMCGVNTGREARNIFSWGYLMFANQSGIKIIFAIPSIIKVNGKMYYIGEFPENADGRNLDSESILYSKIKEVPSEFILGHLKYVRENGGSSFNYDFILNPNYIGFKSEIEQQEFLNLYERELIDETIPTLDEKGFEFAKYLYKEYVNDDSSSYYYDKYFEKYEELQNSKTR